MLTPIPLRDIMVEEVQTIEPGETARTAAIRLEEIEAGSLVVANDGPVGIVTEKDIVSVLANGHDPSTVDLDKGMYRLSTRVFDDDGMVIDGLATVMVEDAN